MSLKILKLFALLEMSWYMYSKVLQLKRVLKLLFLLLIVTIEWQLQQLSVAVWQVNQSERNLRIVPLKYLMWKTLMTSITLCCPISFQLTTIPCQSRTILNLWRWLIQILKWTMKKCNRRHSRRREIQYWGNYWRKRNLIIINTLHLAHQVQAKRKFSLVRMMVRKGVAEKGRKRRKSLRRTRKRRKRVERRKKNEEAHKGIVSCLEEIL